MSVLIKGMDMPKNCMDCPFKGFDRAKGRGNICTINESITLHAVLDGVDVKFVRMGDCPLVSVPPHGRLIDADALMQQIEHDTPLSAVFEKTMRRYLRNAPTSLKQRRTSDEYRR